MDATIRKHILFAREGVERPNMIRRWCVRQCRIPIDDARELLGLCGSYDRAQALQALARCMDDGDWWIVFGETWSNCDDGLHILGFLRNRLLRAMPDMLALAMDSNERTALTALPETFTVWRGCYAHNRDGMSWSLSRDVAAGFPMLLRYAHADATPLLMQGVAQRQRSVLKLDREEQEIVTGRVEVVNEYLIDAAGAHSPAGASA